MPEIEFFEGVEEIKTDLEQAKVGAFMDSLANAKTPQQAKEMFEKRLEHKRTDWALKQKPPIAFEYKIIATFKDLQNNVYWNALVREKINQFQATRLYYSKKGMLQKRNLSKEELEVIVSQLQKGSKPVESQPVKAEKQKAEQQRKREEKLRGKRQ